MVLIFSHLPRKKAGRGLVQAGLFIIYRNDTPPSKTNMDGTDGSLDNCSQPAVPTTDGVCVVVVHPCSPVI